MKKNKVSNLISYTDKNHQSSIVSETHNISHKGIISNKTWYLDEFSPREQQLTACVSRAVPSWHRPVPGGHERGTRRHHLCQPLDLLFEPLELASQVTTALGSPRSNKCNANVCIDPGVLPWFASLAGGSTLPCSVRARTAGCARCLSGLSCSNPVLPGDADPTGVGNS
jgi:hypothetical protein